MSITIMSEELIFPKLDGIEERITISRYPGARHYYLTSNIDVRVFAENRYFSKSSAYEAAIQFVSKEKIIIKEDSFSYARSGD